MGSVSRRVMALEQAVAVDGPDPAALRHLVLLKGEDGVVRDGSGAAVDLEAAAAALLPHGMRPVVLTRAMFDEADRDPIYGNEVINGINGINATDEGDEA